MAKKLNVSLAFTADASQAKAELNALKKSLSELVSGVALKTPDFKFTKGIQEATRAAAQLKTQLESAINIKTGNLDLTKFSEAMSKSGMSLEKYQNQLYQLGPAGEKAFADLTRSITMADVPLKRSSKLLDELWTTMKNTARWQLTSSAMHGFMGAVQSAYGYAQDLNKSLNNIRIVTGASTDKMASFAQEANIAAKALSTTTTAYTNASLIFYQQGLSDSEVAERTEVTIKMANAAGASAEKVSEQLTAVWNNFYDGSKSLEYYADVMTALGAATATSTDEISQGLQKFAAVADTVGLSYEYATAALATITSNTRESADVVGTALKTLFARIQGLQLGETLEDGTNLNKYSEALATVGISIYESNGELKAMDNILNEMAAKWDTMSNSQQVALAQTVAGVRQYTQLIALMDNWNAGDSDSMLANLRTVENATGSLQDQADIYAESWEAASKRVRASAEAVYSTILNDEFFIDLTNGFADITDGVKVFIDSLGGVKGLLLAIGSIVTNVFSKQIGQALSNAAFSLQGFLNPQAIIDKQMAQKKKANKLLQQGYKDDDTTSGRQNAEVYEALGTQQLSYIQNAENMSEEELAINQILMDRNRLLADQAIAAGERLQDTEAQIKAEGKSLELQARIAAGRSGKDNTKEVQQARKDVESLTKSYATLSLVGEQLDMTKDLNANSEEFKKLKTNIQDVIVKMAKLDNIKPDEKNIEQLAKSLNIAKDEAERLLIELSNASSVTDLQSAISELADSAGTESAKAVDQLKTALTGCGIEADKAEDMIKQYLAVINKFGPDSLEATEALNKLKSGVTDLTGKMEKAQPQPLALGQAFSKAASAIMAVGQAINTIKGVIDVFKDDNATTGDKILAVVSAIGMLVPAIISVTGALGKVPVAAAGANAALTGTAVTATAAGTAISLSMWQLTLIVAAITAIVAIIIACADAIHKASPEGEFEAASKAAEQAADAASKVQEEYEQIIDTLDGLDEGIEKIHDMERGTLEWRQAIIESNNALIELLSTYGMLDSKNFTVDADGIMQITNEARKILLEQQSLAVQQANNANYMAQVDKNNAKTRLDASESAGDLTLWRSSGDYMYDAVTDNSQLSANIGMAIGEALAQGRLQNEDLTDVSKLTGVLSEVNGLYGQEAEMLARQIVANEDLITSFGELGASVTAATEANRILNNQIIESNFGDQIDNSGFNDASRENLTNMMGKALEEEADRLYQSKYRDKGALGGGMTDAKIQEDYAKAMGWATDTIDNQSGNKAKYYTKDGKEIGVISDEIARKYLAQQEAIKQMGGDVQSYINTLNELIQVGNNIGKGVGEALGTFAGGQYGDLSSLNNSQLKELRDQVSVMQSDGTFNIGDQVIDEAYAKKLGYETVQAYYDAIQNEIAATGETLDVNKLANSMGITQVVNGIEKTYNTAGESFKKLFADNSALDDEMTAGQKKAFAEAYKRIFEEGGTEALDMVDKVIAQAEDKGDELANLISQTNWNDANAADNFIKQIDKMGIRIDSFDATSFVNEMKEIYGSVNNFTADQFREEFAELSEIVSGLEVGDTISAEDYAKLGEGYSEYFTLMADGTYKLTGDAKEFYNTVMQNKRQELMNSIQENKKILEESQAQYEAAGKSMGNMDAITIGESQMYSNEAGKLQYKGGNVTDQVDFIEQMGGVSADQIAAWREELSDGTAPVETLNAIAEAAGNCGAEYNAMGAEIEANKQALENSVQALFTTATSLEDLHRIAAQVQEIMGENGVNIEYYVAGLKNLASQYEHCTDEIEAYNEAILSGNTEKAIEALEEMEASVLAGEMADQFDLAGDEIEDYAKRLKSLHKDLELSSKEAVKLATANMRLDRGIGNLNDNLKDYKKALGENNVGSAEWSKALSDLKTDLADILNVADGSMLSDAFAQTTLASEDLKLALDGDVDAILRLRLAAADDIIANLDVDDSSLRIVNEQWEFLKANMAEGVAAGNVDQTALINSFNEMIKAGQMTKEQIEAALAGLHVSANVKTNYVQQETTVPTTITDEYLEMKGVQPYVVAYDTNGSPITASLPMYRKYTQTYSGEPVKVNGWVPQYSIEGTEGPGNITTAFTSLPSPTVSKSQTTSGKSPGKGGGGSSKKQIKETKTAKDEIDRYHTVKEQLEELSKQLDKVSKAKDRAFGKAKLDLINQEIELLDKEIEKQELYLSQIESNARSDKALMVVYGAEFDENGVITNYEALMQQELEKYNSAVIAYNNDNNEAAFAAAEARYEKFKEDLAQYEETMDLWFDEEEKRAELLREQYDKQLEALTYKVELEISLEDDELKMIEYYLELIEDDSFAAAEAIALLGEKTQNTLDKIKIYSEGISELLDLHGMDQDDLDQIMAGNMTNEELAEKGFTESDISTLRSYIDELMNANLELKELRDTMQEKVLDAFDAFMEKLDKSAEKIEYLNNVIESYKNIIDLVGVKTLGLNDEFMKNLSQTAISTATDLVEANRIKYESALEAQKKAQTEYEAAIARGDEESIKMWEETLQEIDSEVQESHENMLSSWENALQAAADAFEQAVERTISNFEKAISGTYGSLESLMTAFDRHSEINERYVQDYKKIYELSKLNRDITNSIDETDSIKAKQELKKLQEEINKLQESDTQMSQYDLDYLQKKYDLKLAEIALEDAQNAKTQVRLRRDTEGNFSYVYTGDQATIDNAQQNYEDKLYEMQEFNDDYLKTVQENILNSEIELAEALAELDRTKFATDEEYYAEVNRITEYYVEQHKFWIDEANKALKNNKNTYEEDWNNYSKITGYKISKNEEYVDSFDETIYAQLTGYESLEEAQFSFVEATNIMIEELDAAFEEWLSNYDAIMQAAGTSSENFATDTTQALETVKEESSEAVEQASEDADDISDAFGEICDAVSAWQEEYSDAVSSAIDSNENMIDSCTSLIAQLSSVNGSLADTGRNFISTASEIAAAAESIEASAARAAAAAANISSAGSSIPSSTSGTGTKQPTMHASGTYTGNITTGVNSTYKTVNGVYYVKVGSHWVKNSDLNTYAVFKGGNSSGGTYAATNIPTYAYYDTGGYTGAWGNYGKLAVLHEKELVLNKQDTENLLTSVEILRNIINTLDLQANYNQLSGILTVPTFNLPDNDILEQIVQIQAEFPNVTNRSEIEEAFDTLINRASQYANRKK